MHSYAEINCEDRFSGSKIRCVLVHDYRLIRQGIRCLLEGEPDIEIVAESVNAAEALRHIFEHRPDVVIAASHLFDDPEGAAQRLIQQECPLTRVFFLHAGAEHAWSVNQSERATFVMPHSSAEEFVEMIRRAHPNYGTTVREIPRRMPDELMPSQSRPRKRLLTTREREVLKLLAEGRTVRSAAAFLGLSIKTVDAHKFNLMRKLGIHNKAELVMWAIQKRVVKLPANF